MLDLGDVQGYEFLRPLVQGWLSKCEAALTCGPRKKWKEVADECLMFYSRSAAAMWDSDYTRKFWRGVKAPKFRITINKAYEFVAVFGPSLIWDIPYRQVSSKKRLDLPLDLFQGDEQFAQTVQAMSQQESAQDQTVAALLQSWLNYTPREMPGGGLESHNELAVVDAMLMGRGLLWPQLYRYPESSRTLTGCFRRPPTDLLIDPDFKTLQEAQWVGLRHVDAYWKVERRFRLPPGSLKNRSSLESSWHYNELAGNEQALSDRKSGKTNDLVVWYEIWSKTGTGARLTGMPDFLKNHLEEVVGDYAYLAICPDCPYPLNCPTDKIRSGASDEEIRSDFEWPVPFWKDDRWPFEALDFYHDPESAWPVPPLAPALGELKFLNFIIPWLCNRIYSSSRDFWAVAGGHFDEYKKTLENGEDQVVFPVPPGVEDVRKQIMTLQQPETRADAWRIVELVLDLFDKRTGLTEFAYGQNEQGTQDRTAETTRARAQAVGVRPEHMQKKVIAWQSRAAAMEAALARRFIGPEDVSPVVGQAGAMLWQQFVSTLDEDAIYRQMQFDIAASSIRRPNRDKMQASFNEYLDRFMPLVQAYGQLTGDFTPANGAAEIMGEMNDLDISRLLIPAKDPNDPQVAIQQQMQQAELQKTQAEAQKLMAEAQANPLAEMQMEAQFKQQELQLEQEAEVARLQMEMQKLQAELEAKRAELQLKVQEKRVEMELTAQQHQQELALKQQQGQLDLAVKREQGAQQIAQGRQQMQMQQEQHQIQMRQQQQAGQQKLAQASAQTKAKVESTKATTQAKVQATKQMAAAKPKPTTKR